MSKPAENKKGSQASDKPGQGEEDDEELKPVDTGAAPLKSKLDFNQLALFGFNDVEQPKKYGNVETIRDTGGKSGGADRRRSRNATVVYGADSDDDLDDTDYHQDYYDQYAADADVSDEDDDEGDDERTTEQDGMRYYDYTETLADVDEEWEDEDEEEEDDEDSEEREEAEREARIAAEMERERLRELRLQEILKKKEDLVERYLKVARVMINLRKKNIYLQDYLYHLALRKGLLRGDPTTNRTGPTNSESDSMTVKFAKAQDKRERRRNNTMAARFARFLRKTGHFWDPEEDQHHEHIHHHYGTTHHTHQAHNHHHHHHRGKNLMRGAAHQEGQFRNRISRHYNVFRYNNKPMHQTQPAHHNHPQHHHKPHMKVLPSTAVPKGDPSKACVFGKDCRHVSEKQELRLHAKMLRQKAREKARRESQTQMSGDNNMIRRRNSKKPMSLKELLEMKAAATIKKLMKGPTDALEVFEKHRCKMAKKKQLIKISKLLERQYAGTSLIDPERIHLISFVEHSVTQQNLAKKKALRKKKHQQEKEIKSMGVQHMNHQWIRALDRIRELRLKKAKLEQEHRLELMRKVKHWHIWERRDMTALEAVYDFVTNLSSKVSMSKRETEHFSVGIHQFWKQLHSLHNTVIQQLIRLFKARSMLYMAQRKVKDNATVSSPMKGFTIADYQRMIIENDESHQKLRERQEHLRQQHEKLKDYVEKVANSHLKKQRTWGTLRAGRHDLKQLFELCRHERNNLLRKVREIRRTEKRHRRFFTQVSVMGNKNCLKDFQKVHGRVQELDDKQRRLNTELQQSETIYRVLKVKVTDAQRRIDEAERERRAKALKDDMDFYKGTMKQRINPKLPGTVYAANMMSRKSMEKLYSGEKDRERCGYYFTGSTSPKPTEQRQEKLPPIVRKGK